MVSDLRTAGAAPGTGIAGLVGVDGAELTALIAGLSALQVTLACAESLTGGLLTALLTEVPGASAVVRGGLVVYATDLKHTLAGVDAELLARRGPVDPEVAIALADGARAVCGASVGVGLTGVAGPDQQHGVAVGTWYVAMTGERAGRQRIEESAAHLPTDGDSSTVVRPRREAVRHAAVRAAVGLLSDLVRTG